MLKNMIFTPVTIRVLQFLSEDPGDSFHSREVARRAGVSSGAASLTLRKLHKNGLIIFEKKGRMKFYRADLSNPVSRQFKVLFNLLSLQRLFASLKDRSDRLILFGSSAEGTNARDSDVDLFILTQEPAKVKEIVRSFRDKLDRNLSPIIADSQGLAKLRRGDRSLYENISRGVVLWQKE